MGSGYLMNAAALHALRKLDEPEQREALEALGLDFLVDLFNHGEFEDFCTRSQRGAEIVAKALRKDFLEQRLRSEDFSVDVFCKDGLYKVGFFK